MYGKQKLAPSQTLWILICHQRHIFDLQICSGLLINELGLYESRMMRRSAQKFDGKEKKLIKRVVMLSCYILFMSPLGPVLFITLKWAHQSGYLNF